MGINHIIVKMVGKGQGDVLESQVGKGQGDVLESQVFWRAS